MDNHHKRIDLFDFTSQVIQKSPSPSPKLKNLGSAGLKSEKIFIQKEEKNPPFFS